jgi:hypothetical protein
MPTIDPPDASRVILKIISRILNRDQISKVPERERIQRHSKPTSSTAVAVYRQSAYNTITPKKPNHKASSNMPNIASR